LRPRLHAGAPSGWKSWTLEETLELIRNRPEKAVDYLVKLRAAVLVPIHDLLSDKLLGPERAAVLRRRDRPPSATPECFPAAPAST
jgi:hypothetical protein